MTPTVLVNCTHGRDQAERATLSFVVGNVSATADQPTAVLLTIDGVWLATTGYADDIEHPGLPPLREALTSFVDAGGEIWACGACTGPRGITAATSSKAPGSSPQPSSSRLSPAAPGP